MNHAARDNPPPAPRPAAQVTRGIVRSWRRLTSPPARRAGGGAPTLLACSGGADSSALVLALATAHPGNAIAHIVHDMRPEADALADRDRVRELANVAGLPFHEARVQTRATPGNPEKLARDARYRELHRLATQIGCPFVATAHHADDQLESIIMALIRGAGLRGLRGIAASRPIDQISAMPGYSQGDDAHQTVMLVRPMLDVSHDENEGICRDADWSWCVDATNTDASRVRAKLRADVIPQLLELRPGAAAAARTAAMLNDLSALLDDAANGLSHLAEVEYDEGEIRALSWSRAQMSSQRDVIIGEVLRRAAVTLTGVTGLDQIGKKSLDPIVRAIGDGSTEPRSFELSNVEVCVTGNRIRACARIRGQHG